MYTHARSSLRYANLRELASHLRERRILDKSSSTSCAATGAKSAQKNIHKVCVWYVSCYKKGCLVCMKDPTTQLNWPSTCMLECLLCLVNCGKETLL